MRSDTAVVGSSINLHDKPRDKRAAGGDTIQ